MDQEIQILKNERLLETITLGKGSYRIGRDPSSDIQLNDPAVSKVHATIQIDDGTVTVRDNQSSNGTFVKGKRITEKEFKKTFRIDIPPFSIQTQSSTLLDNDTSRHRASATLTKLVARNYMLSSAVLISLLLLISIAALYTPFKNRLESTVMEQHMHRGVLLSKYLAEMNRPFLQEGRMNHVRVLPVEKEEGVLYAFVLDGYGRIIAPQDQQGDFFNWNELAQAFREGKPKVSRGFASERLIFTPIGAGDGILGAAIIGFSPMPPGSGGGMGGRVLFLLVVLLPMGMFLAGLFVKALLRPIGELNEAVELSIKEGRDMLSYDAPYKELDNIKSTLNRLLLRNPVAPETPKRQEEPSVREEISSGKPAGDGEDSAIGNPDESPSPGGDSEEAPLPGLWCMIHREDYTVRRLSENFLVLTGFNDCKEGSHIIEAFDAALIQVISRVMDETQDKPEQVELSGKRYRISRIDRATAGEEVLIAFEETD